MQPDLFDPATWGAPLPLGPRARPVDPRPLPREPRAWSPPDAPYLVLSWDECIYCGSREDITLDHVVPYSFNHVDTRKRLGGGKNRKRDCVPCCRECNSLLGSKLFITVNERAEYLAARLSTRHGKLLSTPDWELEDINELGFELGTYVKNKAFQKKVIQKRIEECAKTANITTPRYWNVEEAPTVPPVTLMEIPTCRADYSSRRVLAELKKGPRTGDALAASLNLAKHTVRSALCNHRARGLYIVGEGGGLYHFFDNAEDAAQVWAGYYELMQTAHMLGLLMERPHTTAELMVIFGMPRNFVNASIDYLRKKGYNIESRGGRSGHPGTYHMIQDERHPWLHLGAMDLRGAAYDDRE